MAVKRIVRGVALSRKCVYNMAYIFLVRGRGLGYTAGAAARGGGHCLHTEKVNSNTYFKNAVPLQGWRFDFSDVLRTYLVSQYGQWTEYKATDKTGLRRLLYGRIDRIVELQKETL